MTLTISLVADGLIVQSADNRLLQVPGRSLYDDAAPKQMAIYGYDWAASVAYAGVGQVRGRDTASQVLYQAASTAGDPSSLTFDQVVEAIALHHEKWLKGVRGDRRHSLTVAGMVVRDCAIHTRVALVSNYQHFADDPTTLIEVPTTDEFRISTADVERPTVLVGGMH